MRPVFAIGEYYHIYNRGTDKRDVFLDEKDMNRFFLSMKEFNSMHAIGSIHEKTFERPSLGGPTSKPESLVEFIAYCLNPNHYHFILRQTKESGIQKFMQRLGTGYTMYFNERYTRNGVLFQGKYKAKHVPSNEYLLHLSAYVNLNFKVHRLGDRTSKSSWDEYRARLPINFCSKEVILEQFSSCGAYERYSQDALIDILIRKEKEKDLRNLLLE